MLEKRCFKCGQVKLLTEFYAHPTCRDGHLGKCKVCTYLDTRRHAVLRQERGRPLDTWVRRAPGRPPSAHAPRPAGPPTCGAWQAMLSQLTR